MFQGPCLPHCYMTAPLTVNIARLAFVYIVACLGYLLATRNIGTPFSDSLTKEQKQIKQASAEVRKNAFFKSAIVGVVLVIMWRPFTHVS